MWNGLNRQEYRGCDMRIYAVADLHAKTERLSRIQEKVAALQPDVLVVAGDISAYFKRSGVIHQLDRMTVPVFVVRGNSDFPQVDDLIAKASNITSLHRRTVQRKGVVFSGVNGTIPVPFRSRIALRESGIVRQAAEWIQGRSVFVAHPPPWGMLDGVFGKFHAGSRAVREIIRRYQPEVFICGHIHEDSGAAYMGRTLVVNCSVGKRDIGAVIDMSLDSDRPPTVDFG